MRRVAFVTTALLTALLFAPPAAAASATSWRALIVGRSLHGGATTLIASDGTGTIKVKLSGVTPGLVPVVHLNPTICPTEANILLSFSLSAATPTGVSTGRLALTAGQVKAYNAALTARIRLSIVVVTADDMGCGDQRGAPSVGTARIIGTVAAVAAPYDVRYPVVGGIDPSIAAAVNMVLAQAAQAAVAAFTKDATSQGAPARGDPASTATQTFSVSLSEPSGVSLAELYSQYNTGAAHPFATLSTYTFDLATGHQLRLADLFRPGSAYLSVLSRESRTRLRILLHDPSLDSWIDGGTGPSAANFAGWQLVSGGLRITFAEYQVGPYAIGMRAIVIPWSALRSVIRTTPAAPSIVTLADTGTTIRMVVGGRFLLSLGTSFDWTISIADPSVIARVQNITVVVGAQGVYQALARGTTILSAIGDPPCRKASPPCLAPSLLFQIHVEVQ